jgi:integrase
VFANLIPFSDTGQVKESKLEQTSATWQKTQYANLIRYVPSGTLFARLKVRGKLIRQSLDTSDLEVGHRKLRELERKERGASDDARNGKVRFVEALEIFRQRGYRSGLRKKKDKPLKQRTRDYYEERITALFKSWPELATDEKTKRPSLLIRDIAEKDCEQWADRFRQSTSASAYNHTISVLRHVLHIGMKQGARYDNPADSLGRATEAPKKLTLPEPTQFDAFVKAISKSGSGWSDSCAQLVRFLAYGGFRITEAKHITWADCNFKKGQIAVWGHPTNRTKNGEHRFVPMIPEMKKLLESMRAERADEPANTRVVPVCECQRAMDGAAKKVGMPRITHHDLRHLFATRCIESGVDIPTVSKWLGHKDGGALAMKTYGHLRDEHSTAMAQKVTFRAEAA